MNTEETPIREKNRPSVRWQRLYNPLVIGLLRSPLHTLMSDSTMLVTYRGRKSGKERTTPVNYVREGGALLVVSSRDHSWWKNLRGGAPVVVRVRGDDLRGLAAVFEGEEARDGLLAVLQRVPAYRRHWKVELGAEGRPTDPKALGRVARENVLVRIERLSAARAGLSDEC